MTQLGYARTSTVDQQLGLSAQVEKLREAGCSKIFEEHASGKLASRPQLDQLLEYARQGDSVVVTKLDRLGRSLAHLTRLGEELEGRGINLTVLDLGMDTSTPTGRLMFGVLGAVAEFERSLISERTLAGLERARARGRAGGRKRSLTSKQIAAVQRRYDEGETVAAIAASFGVSRPTIYRSLDVL